MTILEGSDYMRAVCSKARGAGARLALVTHIIQKVATGEDTTAPVTSLERLGK